MPQGYSSWSLEKLKKERKKIDKAIETAEKRDKKATLAKMAIVARQNGFELHELIADASVRQTGDSTKKIAARRPKRPKGSKRSKARAKVAPKYQHPDNPDQTWTGRGRQPLWVKALIDGGATLDALTISGAGSK
ncbi:MAG: H-NS family nucleoid-associated regulatory protein [Granulosicoccus sp.]